MAFTLQPTYGQGGSYTAQGDRLLTQAVARTDGPIKLTAPVAGAMTGDLAVTSSGTTNAKVSVAAGSVFIPWTTSAGQGLYHAYNDAAIASAALASNSSGSNRYDLISIQVTDSGGSTSAAVVVTTGTSSPSGPAVPSNATPLAIVAVPTGFTGASQVSNGNIVDIRRKGGVSDLSIPGTASSTVVPNATAGMTVYSDIGTTEEGIYTYNGTAWRKPWNMPWGWMDDVFYTSNSSGGTTVTVMSGLTATAIPNRIIEVQCQFDFVATSGSVFQFELKNNGTTIETLVSPSRYTGSSDEIFINTTSYIYTTTGSVLNFSIVATELETGEPGFRSSSSLQPAKFVMKDIGPAGTPA